MIKRSHQKFLRKADLGVTDMELWDLYDKDGNQTIEITDMELSHIAEYAELFVSVFNAEPWNDSWTKETAQIRIENMMKTGTFIGKALSADNGLKGIAFRYTAEKNIVSVHAVSTVIQAVSPYVRAWLYRKNDSAEFDFILFVPVCHLAFKFLS